MLKRCLSWQTEHVARWAALAAAVGAVAIAGCGSSSSSSSSSSGASSSASGSSSSTAAAAVSGSGGSLCVSSLVGYAIVPELLQTWKDTASANHLSYTASIAGGDATTAHSNTQSCVTRHAKVTVNITTPDTIMAAPVHQAVSQGDFYIGQYAGTPAPGETMSIGPNDAGMSKQLFNWVEANMVKKGIKPVVLALNTPAFPVVVQRIDTFDALAKAAGWKIVGPTDISATNPTTDATSKTAAALQSNPDINLVLAYTDDVSFGIEAAVREANKTKTVKIVEYEGLEPTYAQMRHHSSIVGAVAGAPIDAYDKLEKWAVRQMLAGKFKAGTIAQCIGPLITDANVPPPGQNNPGGSCVIGGKTYSYSQLVALAS